MPLVENTDKGLYCPGADMYIDPWRPVPKALITHAHSDHARYGMGLYIAHQHCVPILKARLGSDIITQGVAFNETLNVNGVHISFHPAGHIPGSAQIRIEHKGEVLVVSGDYKTEDDGLSIPFEPVRCHTFITESTFGLPIFRWRPQHEIMAEIHQWWNQNRREGITSLIQAYSLGKAQRILQQLDLTNGPVYVHTAVDNMNTVVREYLPQLKHVPKWTPELKPEDFRGSLIIAPPGSANSPWANRFNPYSNGVASGWMNLRGARRWQAADRGFVLSDHADWKGLVESIKGTGAENILVTHGYTEVFVKWLCEQGYNARELHTEYTGEEAQPAPEIPNGEKS